MIGSKDNEYTVEAFKRIWKALPQTAPLILNTLREMQGKIAVDVAVEMACALPNVAPEILDILKERSEESALYATVKIGLKVDGAFLLALEGLKQRGETAIPFIEKMGVGAFGCKSGNEDENDYFFYLTLVKKNARSFSRISKSGRIHRDRKYRH